MLQKHPHVVHSQLRWDRGDLISFYNYTGKLLEPIATELNDIEINNIQHDASAYSPVIDRLYENIVIALNVSAKFLYHNTIKTF